MCGRYTLVRVADLTEIFPWVNDDLPEAPPRYNIAPTQPILAIANDRPDKYDFFFWGLVPPWAKDTSIGARMINARGETLGTQSAFRNAYRRRRCLIPADGFYEWKKSPDSKKKTPMATAMANMNRSRREPTCGSTVPVTIRTSPKTPSGTMAAASSVRVSRVWNDSERRRAGRDSGSTTTET